MIEPRESHPRLLSQRLFEIPVAGLHHPAGTVPDRRQKQRDGLQDY